MNDEQPLWFVFCKNDLMIERTAEGYDVPCQTEAPVPLKPWTAVHSLTAQDGRLMKCLFVDSPVTDHPRYEMCGLRRSYQLLPYDLYLKAGKCAEILYWDINTRYCGVCGGPMKKNTEISKRCTCCGKEVWPQLATAVICLIHRGEEALLVHARNFKTNDMYGLVAGFVETGETLEEAVEREVSEETGLSIRNIRYFASQPWPYPCGLMVGFYAEYAGGELHLQRSELSAGNWFRYDALPHIPEKLSIARKLIDNWRKKLMED